jgi:branched-chain amino acid transport system permease protein
MPWTFLKYLVVMAIAFGVAVAAYDFASVRSGYINLGQTFVMGVAGYGAAFMSQSLVYSAVGSTLLGAFGGLLLGLLAVRIRGAYYAIATMVMPLLLIVLARTAYSVFKGDDGISIWALQSQINIDSAAAVLIAVAALMAYLTKTRFGLIIRSISYDEMLTISSGINTALYKLGAYIIAGAATGVATFYLVMLSGIMSTALIEPIPWIVYMLLASGVKPGDVVWSFSIGTSLYIIDVMMRASFPNLRLFIISLMLVATYAVLSKRYATVG